MHNWISCLLLLMAVSCTNLNHEDSSNTQEETIKKVQIEKEKTEPINNTREDEKLTFGETPTGLKIGEYYASDNTEYWFCSDNKLRVSLYSRLFFIGTWKMHNDTIWMHLLQKYERIGIGEPLPSSQAITGNILEEYSTYQEIVTASNEKEFLIWTEIKELIAKDAEYPYQLLKRGINCNGKEWESFEY